MVKRWEGRRMLGAAVNFAEILDVAVTDRREGGLGESDDKLFWQNDKSGPAGWRASARWWHSDASHPNPSQPAPPPVHPQHPHAGRPVGLSLNV